MTIAYQGIMKKLNYEHLQLDVAGAVAQQASRDIHNPAIDGEHVWHRYYRVRNWLGTGSNPEPIYHLGHQTFPNILELRVGDIKDRLRRWCEVKDRPISEDDLDFVAHAVFDGIVSQASYYDWFQWKWKQVKDQVEKAKQKPKQE